MFLAQLPFRVLFIFEGIRYRERATSMIRVMIYGLLGDLLVAIPLLFSTFFSLQILIVPIPVMTLLGFLVLYSSHWKEDSPIDSKYDAIAHDNETMREQYQKTVKDEMIFIIALFLLLLFVILPYIISTGINYHDEYYVSFNAVPYIFVITERGTNSYFNSAFIFSSINIHSLLQIPRLLVPVIGYYYFEKRVSLKHTLIISVFFCFDLFYYRVDFLSI